MKYKLTLRQMVRKTLKTFKYSVSLVGKVIRAITMSNTSKKHKLTATDKRIIDENCKNRWSDQGGSLRKTEMILKQKGTTVCKETIRKYINSQPWGKLRRQPRTFLMTEKNKRDGLAFATRFNNLGLLEGNAAISFAKSIFFTDEKYFHLSHKPNPQNHRFRGDVSDLKVQKVPKFDAKVLVCAGFSFRGVTPIKFIKGTVDQVVYTTNILPFYKDNFYRRHVDSGILETCLFEEQGGYFQQDGAKPHTAIISTNYIIKEFPDYFYDWPGNSPDLSPIENLWSIVQAKVDNYPFATTITELRGRIEAAWSELDPEHLENLALSFPKRLKSVLTNQ